MEIETQCANLISTVWPLCVSFYVIINLIPRLLLYKMNAKHEQHLFSTINWIHAFTLCMHIVSPNVLTEFFQVLTHSITSLLYHLHSQNECVICVNVSAHMYGFKRARIIG